MKRPFYLKPLEDDLFVQPEGGRVAEVDAVLKFGEPDSNVSNQFVCIPGSTTESFFLKSQYSDLFVGPMGKPGINVKLGFRTSTRDPQFEFIMDPGSTGGSFVLWSMQNELIVQSYGGKGAEVSELVGGR